MLSATALATALWVVPELRILILPLVYYNTHVHELCHALAAVATGGGVQHILVFANGSGVAQITGGWTPAVASAGYVGSTMVGGLVLAWARNETGARRALGAAAVFLGISLVLFVRGDGVGLLSAFGWLVALILAAARTRGATTIFLAQFIGLQLCLTSLQAFVSLFNVAASIDGHSDAKILEQATGLPDLLWAALWLAMSLVVVWASLRAAWQPAQQTG